MTPDAPAVAISPILEAADRALLQGLRARLATAGAAEAVAALDALTRVLDRHALHGAIGRPRPDLTLEQRVQEAVRVFEVILAHKHNGRRVPASRSRAMIRRWGERETIVRIVGAPGASPGLAVLAVHGRLDCTYERIVLDFPDQFHPDLVLKAQASLARLPAADAA